MFRWDYNRRNLGRWKYNKKLNIKQMLIEVTKEFTPQKEFIEVEFPYYFEKEFGSEMFNESYLYGKVEEDKCTTIIHQSHAYQDGERYDIELEYIHDIVDWRFGFYFKEEYKSSKETFENIQKKLLAFISKF